MRPPIWRRARQVAARDRSAADCEGDARCGDGPNERAGGVARAALMGGRGLRCGGDGRLGPMRCCLPGAGRARALAAWRGAGGTGRQRGELAGLPEGEDVFEACEDAGQAGDDEGVHAVGHPTGRRRRRQGGAQAGELVAQGGGG